jgi:hypothetical protein
MLTAGASCGSLGINCGLGDRVNMYFGWHIPAFNVGSCALSPSMQMEAIP